MLRALLGLDGLGKRTGVEPAAPPGNRRVVDVVGDAEIAERDEVPHLNAVRQRALEYPVVGTQREEVRAIHAVWRRSEAQQEVRPEVVDNPAVAASGSVMELVDDDVVEPLPVEPVQVPG